MRTPSRPPRLIAIGTGILCLCALTACAPGGQSKTDACIIVADGLEDVQAQMAQANDQLVSGDLLSVVETLDDVSATLGDLEPTVTNDDVAPILTALREGIDAVRDAVAGSGSDDVEAAQQALQDSGSGLSNAALRFNETCGG